MIKKICKYILTVIVVFFIIIMLTVTVNQDLRRKILNYPSGLINYYYKSKIINSVNFKDYASVSEIFENYINISQKISKGKNKMTLNIFKELSYATQKAETQNQFNLLLNIFEKINEIDDKIYLNNVWLGRAYMDNDIKLSQKHLKKAIQLSPASEQAYREIIRLINYKKDLNLDPFLIESYCVNYFSSKNGGTTKFIYNNFFDGNLEDFGFFLNNEFNEIYKQRIHSLNEYINFNFTFDEIKTINSINIIGTFVEGSIVSIKDILINNNLETKINLNDIILIGKNIYVLNELENELKLLNTNDDNKKIKFVTNSINNVETISFDMKVTKVPITNINFCKTFYEN